MRSTIKKWGNSASIRIPVAILEATQLSLDDEVDIREENGRIVISPRIPPVEDLSALLDGVTEDNLHDEIDFGAPVGREVL